MTPQSLAPVAATTIIEVRHLSRSFGGLVAVDDVSFAVCEHEIFGLIGPNGAGKTTFFNLISGLIPPTAGQLIYQGQDITRLAPHRIAARGLARTFQNIRLFGNLTARENVIVGQYVHTKTGLIGGVLNLPAARQEQVATGRRALELLELLGLEQHADEQAHNLSYGDQRRLEIARALALQPRLLLLDEPAAGMNTAEKQQLGALIRQIRDLFGLTVLLIEHNVPLVMGLCDRIAVLNFGKLIAVGDPAAVQNNPAVVEAYLGVE